MQLDTAGKVLEGYITRLGETSADISLHGSFVGANEVIAFFRRPSDGIAIGLPGQVMEITSSGGLWRGKPSVRIRFTTSLNLAPMANSWPVNAKPRPEPEVTLPTGEIPGDREDGPTRSIEDRVLSDVPVRFSLAGEETEGTAGNFSRGGMYIACNEYPRVGAVVHVHFPVYTPSGELEEVEFNGVVRWFQQDRPELDLPTGFGVQIMSFESDEHRDLYIAVVDHLLSLSGG